MKRGCLICDTNGGKIAWLVTARRRFIGGRDFHSAFQPPGHCAILFVPQAQRSGRIDRLRVLCNASSMPAPPPSRLARRLVTQHLLFGVIGLGAVFGIQAAIDSTHAPYRWSMATAYVALLFLGATLATGPINLLRRRANPLSTDLRRDLGIWCGLISLAHVVAGVQVHMQSMWLYFVKEITGPKAWTLRDDLFGLANYTGLVATMIVLLLLVLSNDASIRWLGAGRWKNLQRWNYAFLLLTALHGALYQVLEKRAAGWRSVFWALLALTLVVQTAGIARRIWATKKSPFI